MMKKNIIETLENRLKEANSLYRQGLTSEFTDQQYDTHIKNLENLYKETNIKIPENSILNLVGSKVDNKFIKIKHNIPMLSLDNTYNKDELKLWISKTLETLNDTTLTEQFIVQEKVDGCSLSIIYNKGKLTSLITRGDGIEGDDITVNKSLIKNIPEFIPLMDDIEIRGEVYMEFNEFDRINKLLSSSSSNKPIYANARNLCAGTLKAIDKTIVSNRNLKFKVHSVGKHTLKNINSLNSFFNLCKSFGFEIADYKSISITDISNIFNYIDILETSKTNKEYPIDGAVIKLNNFNSHNILGTTHKVPKWGIAYKYDTEKVETIVKDIKLQVGRTGAITPVAILEPVNLCNTIVQRATCHNIDEMMSKDIRIGDSILIEKSGEIIPYIIGVNKEYRKGKNIPKFIFDEKCPICGSKAIKYPGIKHWFCSNANCPEILQRKLEYFVSRDCMNIECISSAWIKEFLSNGIIKKLSDFYNIKKEQLLLLNRMGDKLANKIIANIEYSRNIKKDNLWKVINALGIPNVGKSMSKDIIKYFGYNIKSFLNNSTYDALLKINGISDKTANCIINYLDNNKDEINNILSYLYLPELDNIDNENEENNTLPYKDMTFVITGTFVSKTREDLIKEIESKGGKVSSSISKKTNYLLLGENAGSKLEKAKKLNINIIHELF